MEGYYCPNCKNLIFDEEALMCHFCGESLHRAGKGFLGRIKYANQKVIWYFLIFFVLFGFILMIVF